MHSFLIEYKDDCGYRDNIVILAYSEGEAVGKFYKQFPFTFLILEIL